MSDVIATEIERLDPANGTLASISAVVDGAGNIFECESNIIGNIGVARVTKRDMHGAVISSIRVFPAANRKIDSCSLLLDGADVHVYATSHLPDAANHYYAKEKYIWQAIAIPLPAPGPGPGPLPTNDPILQSLSLAIHNVVVAALTGQIKP